MGLLEFNVAELVSRLRSSLKVRGRLPLTVDDSAIVTVTGLDATRAPYRASEQRYRMNLPSNPGVAAEYPVFALINNTQRAVVLEELEVFTRQATVLFVNSLWGAQGVTTNFPFWTTEPDGNGFPAGRNFLPGVTLGQGSSAVLPVGTSESPFSVQLQGNASPENRYRWTNCELVIAPLQTLTIFGTTVNVTTGCSAIIRSCPQIP